MSDRTTDQEPSHGFGLPGWRVVLESVTPAEVVKMYFAQQGIDISESGADEQPQG